MFYFTDHVYALRSDQFFWVSRVLLVHQKICAPSVHPRPTATYFYWGLVVVTGGAKGWRQVRKPAWRIATIFVSLHPEPELTWTPASTRTKPRPPLL